MLFFTGNGMVEFSFLGGIVIATNLLLTILLQAMKGIGLKRSAAISGWVSLIVGLIILVIDKGVQFVSSALALILGLVVVFAILFIILPALMPHAHLTVFRYPVKFFTKSGYFIGYAMGVILGLLK